MWHPDMVTTRDAVASKKDEKCLNDALNDELNDVLNESFISCFD